ncbi:hypothetical protein HDU81_000936 [Chytriomyces hyalinus]|nr:hypothetical protein HDU81_000936 [Chytriomyces hyalinus]
MTTSTDDFNLSSDSDQSLPHSGQQLRNQRRLSAKERDLLHAQALAHFNQPQQQHVGGGGGSGGGVTSSMRGSALERKGSAGASVRSSKSELHSPISIPPLDYKRRNMDLNLGFIGSELSNSYGLQDNNNQQQQPPVESLLSQSEYFREIPFPGNLSNTAAYPSQVSASPSIHSMASASADYEGVGQHAQVRSFATAPRRPGTRQERTASLALSHGYSPSITDSQHQNHSAPTTPTAASIRERGASVGINTRPLTDMQSPASSPTSQLHHNLASSQHAPIPSPLNIAPAMLRTNPLSNIASASGLTSQPFNPLSSNNVESPSASTPSYPQLSIYRSPSNASFAFDQATTPITPRNVYPEGRQSGDDLFDSNAAFQMPIHMQNLQLQQQQTQSRDASDNGSVSSKSAKSVKVSNGNKHNEPIHPIVSSPPIRLNLVGRAKSISGSTTTANGEGAVRSSGESHMSGESDKSSNGTEGKKEKIKEKVVNVAFGPPVKLNLQRRKSEIHVKQRSLLDESASVVSKGDSKADAVLQGMFQGNHAALIGKLSRGLSHKKKRSQSPHSGNDSSDTAPQSSPPTRLPNSIPRADFIHLRSSSPSNASVHYMEGSENVVFMAPTPLPGVRSGETGNSTGSEDELIRDTTGMPPRPRGKSISSINEEGEGGEGSALAKFRAKRAAERAAKRGGL